MALLAQRSPQLAVVVDLPVERHADRAVLVLDRRVAVLQVDHRQTSLADPRPSACVSALRIRSPVAHAPQLRRDVLGRLLARPQFAGYAAHDVRPSPTQPWLASTCTSLSPASSSIAWTSARV